MRGFRGTLLCESRVCCFPSWSLRPSCGANLHLSPRVVAFRACVDTLQSSSDSVALQNFPSATTKVWVEQSLRVLTPWSSIQAQKVQGNKRNWQYNGYYSLELWYTHLNSKRIRDRTYLGQGDVGNWCVCACVWVYGCVCLGLGVCLLNYGLYGRSKLGLSIDQPLYTGSSVHKNSFFDTKSFIK